MNRHRLVRTIVGLTLGLLVARGNSAQLDHVSVTKRDGTYVTVADFFVEAPANQVHAALTDFAALKQLNPAIMESNMVTHDGDLTRVMTILRDCIAFFCKKMTLVEDVTIADDGIESTIVGALSDFTAGFARWTLSPIGEHTRIRYYGEIRPDFFVPPLGSRLIRRTLRRQIATTADNLEKLARDDSRLRPEYFTKADGA